MVKSRNEKLYLTVILLMTGSSTHIIQLPLFVGMSKAETTQELKLSNKASYNNKSTYLLNSSCLIEFILWWDKLGKLYHDSKSMAYWTSRRGESS